MLSGSRTPGGITYYDLDWGDGNTLSSSVLGTHYYKESGTYRLRVKCKDMNGNVDSVYQDVVVPGKPAVDLGNDIILAAGDSVTLSNKLHQQPYLYRWSTGSKDVAIKVKAPGTYVLNTTFCGSVATDTIIVTQKKRDELSCDFIYKQTQPGYIKGAIATAIVSTLENDPVIYYEWNNIVTELTTFGSNAKEVYLQCFENGTFPVTLLVRTTSGKTASVTKNIYVTGTVWSLAIDAIPAGICNDSALVTAKPFADEPFHIRWSNGDTGLTTILPRPGRYTATLYDTTNTIRESHTFDLPRSRAFVTGIQLHATSSDSLFAYPEDPGYTVSWFRNDTLIGTGRYIDAPVSGIYTTQTINAAGCMDASLPYNYVARAERMKPAFTAIADKCKPQIIRFDSKATQALTTTDSITAVEWNFGDRATATGKDVTHEYYKSGTYIVKMKLTSVSGYIDSISRQITVLPEEDWSSKVTDDSTSIPGTHILKVITVAKDAFLKWSNGSTKDTTHVKTFGKYFVTLSDSCGNVRSVDSLKVPEPRWNLTITARKIDACGDAVQLIAHTDYYKGTYKIEWFDRKAADSVKVTQPGAYSARLIGDSSKIYASAVFHVDSSMLFKPAIRINATAQSDTLIAFPLQNGNNTYSYTWMHSDSLRVPPVNAPVLIDPVAGYYYLKVMNAEGCIRYSPSVYYQPHDSASIDVTIGTEPCNSQSLLAYPQYKGFGNSIDTVISLSYDWGFDINGTTSNTRSPLSWWYSYPGVYNFRLTGTTRSGRVFRVAKEYTVVETNSPDVDILHDSVSVPGMHMLVAVTRPGKYPVKWGDFSTNDTIITNNPGNYSVVVYNPCGGGLTGVDNVDIYGAPWSLNAGIKRIYCADSAVIAANATALESDSVLTWNTGEHTDVITVKRSGRYIVTLADSRGNIRVRDTVEVLLEKPFQSGITIRNGIDRDTLVATPYNNAYTYTWFRNDSLNFINSPVYPTPADGTYRVEVKNGEGCSDLSEVFTYTKGTKPLTIDFNYSASDCNEQRFLFSTMPIADDAIVKYQWNFGDNRTDTAAAPEYTFTEGTYNVLLTVTSASGKTASINKPLVVPSMSIWPVDIVSAANACGDTVTLKVSTADKARYFKWNTASEERELIVTASGKYSVSVFDSCHNLRGTDTVDVIISEPLKATVTLHAGASVDTLIALPYNAAYTYTWIKDDSLLTTSHLPLYTPAISGDYRVELSSGEGCVSLSAAIAYVAKPGAVAIDFDYHVNNCNEQRFTFTAMPVTGDTLVTYQWNFGDNTIDTAAASEHTFAEGIYNVSLTVTTASGRTGRVSKQLNVSALSKWTVDITPAVNACGDTVTLKVNTTDKVRYFKWNTSSAERQITVTTAGKYSVNVYDSCNNFRGADTISVTIAAPLKATISLHAGTSTDTLIASPYRFDYTYAWYRNDSLLANSNSSAYFPSISGNYRVKVINNGGCNDLSAALIYEVKQAPITISFSYKASDCDEQRFAFSVPQIAGESILNYEWNFDDNTTSSTVSPEHSFTEGTYNVSLTVTTVSGRKATTSKQLVVPVKRKWTVNIVAAPNACGDIVTLNINTDQKARYFQWNNGTADRVMTVSASGTYSVSVFDSCHILRGTDTITVTVNQPLKVAIRVRRGVQDTLVAASLTDGITFPVGSMVPGYSFRWYRNGILQTEDRTFLLNPAAGSYTLQVERTPGCLASVALYYEPIILPDPQVEVGNVLPGDTTLTVRGDFNNNFNADNQFTVQLMLLNPGGRETGMQPNEVIDLGTTPGTDRNATLKVRIPDTLACGSNYVIRMIASSPADTTVWSKPLTIVNQPPVPVITQRGDSLFTTGKYNWQWYKDGAPIAGATSAVYRARANGAYMVESRNGGNCTTRSTPVSVVITAIGEVTLGTNTAKLFPNPSQGPVSVKFEKPLLKAVTINVYDLHGHKVYAGMTTQQLLRLDLGHLPQGYYLVELIGYGTKKVLPLILQ